MKSDLDSRKSRHAVYPVPIQPNHTLGAQLCTEWVTGSGSLYIAYIIWRNLLYR